MQSRHFLKQIYEFAWQYFLLQVTETNKETYSIFVNIFTDKYMSKFFVNANIAP